MPALSPDHERSLDYGIYSDSLWEDDIMLSSLDHKPRPENIRALHDPKAKQRVIRRSMSFNMSALEVSCQPASKRARFLALCSSDSPKIFSLPFRSSSKVSRMFRSLKQRIHARSQKTDIPPVPKIPSSVLSATDTSSVSIDRSSSPAVPKLTGPVTQLSHTDRLQRRVSQLKQQTGSYRPFPFRSTSSAPQSLGPPTQELGESDTPSLKPMSFSDTTSPPSSPQSEPESILDTDEFINAGDSPNGLSKSCLVSLILEEHLYGVIRYRPSAELPSESRYDQTHSFILSTVPQLQDEIEIKHSEDDIKLSPTVPSFTSVFARISNAGPRLISNRLAEQWGGQLDDEDQFQETAFDKRLWALTAYEKLTRGKLIQSPAHELLASSLPEECRRILNLHGSIADGWCLAMRYPACTVFTQSSQTTNYNPSTYMPPTNHHCVSMTSTSTVLPFPDAHFDAIVMHSSTSSMSSAGWVTILLYCIKCLKPGGQLEILTVDPQMSRQGPLLDQWIDANITGDRETRNVQSCDSINMVESMTREGLHDVRRARLALPTVLSSPVSNTARPRSPIPGGDTTNIDRMMAFLGRYLYQASYGTRMRLPTGKDWFWTNKEIRSECRHWQTKMVLTILCAQKPAPALPAIV